MLRVLSDDLAYYVDYEALPDARGPLEVLVGLSWQRENPREYY